jgi:copper chaperone CopZ
MDWDTVKKNVQKGAGVAVEKVSMYSRIGKLKMDQLLLERKIDKNYTSAGLSVYEFIKEGKGESIPFSLVDEFIAEIDGAKKEIEDLDKEIAKIKEESKTKSKNSSDADGSDDNEKAI